MPTRRPARPRHPSRRNPFPQTPCPGFGFVPHTTPSVPAHNRRPLLPSAPAPLNSRASNRTATVKPLAYGVLGDSIP
jgi:hypothetical protein